MTAIPLLKFTPSAMDTEFLEAITVQRESLIQGLVDSALDTEGGNRHHLLVGPRGMGKSHVLTLVAERIRAASDDSLVLAVLNEDPWAVRSYSKLLAAILGAINHPEAAAVRSRGTPEEAERLLREAIGDRRLVLVVENLDEIFRRVGPDGQKRLRAFAENWSPLLVLASTPQLFAAINRHASPFYAFFRITHLDELMPENARELLRRIARLRGDDELVEFLDTETAQRRILAINALAGGHPRIWLLFAGCISIPAIEELVPLFLQALDDLTPYYQSRLDDLGDQQQELVLLLCEAGGALSNRQLAELAGLSQNQVGAVVGKLEDRGYIRSAFLPEALDSGGDGRASYWELREPLMRLALDVKKSRGKPLALVVEFLRSWYGVAILDELHRLPPGSRVGRIYAAAAFRSLLADLSLADLSHGAPEETLARCAEGLALEPDHMSLNLAHALALVELARGREAVESLERLRDRFVADVRRAAVLDIAVQELRTLLGEPPDTVRLETALETLTARDEAARSDSALRTRGRVLSRLRRDEEALAVYDRLLEREPSDASGHHSRGQVLLRLGRSREALSALAQARDLDDDVPTHHASLAKALCRDGRLDEAAASIAEALSREGTNWKWHLTAVEIALERGDFSAVSIHLEKSFRHWRLPPGSTEADARPVLELLWGLLAPAPVLDRVIEAFSKANAAVVLGRALVSLIPEFETNPEAAETWLDEWRSSTQDIPELVVPLSIVTAGTRFLRSRDRASLLALPAEQREIVVGLLERRENGAELGDDVA